MLLWHFNLLILISFCSLSWSSAVKDNGVWPWTKTKYLTRSNWSSLLLPNSDHQPSVWFIFHYLNYCGYCKRAEPGWEAVARYALNWSKYIQIGAYDCASESVISNNEICQDEKYPQWRIYCPVTNSTQLAFLSERRTNNTTAEEILIWLIEKINDIADQCYGKSWSVRSILEAKTKDDLEQQIPKEINKFQLFVSNDVFHYTLYVLNNSETVQTEPIYRLAEGNEITEGVGIWKGIRNETGRIFLQSIDLQEVMKPFVLEPQTSSSSPEQTERNNATVVKPTLSDIDSAVIWMVNRDLRRGLPSLTQNVKDWINVLYTYYPGSESMKSFLYDLNEYLKNHATLSSTEYLSFINSSSIVKLSELKFDHCNSSDPSKRRYPCTLWALFHSMTVKQAILAERNRLSSNVKPSDLVVAIREFIRHFFLCEECVTHFTNMTSNAENEIQSYDQSVLYLWQGHNIVNKRLRYEELSNDLNWPKIPFPSKEQCAPCVQRSDENGDALEFNQNEVFNYFKQFYYLQNSARNPRLNYLRLLLIVLFVWNK